MSISHHIQRLVRTIDRTIERHGGGLSGAKSIAHRAIKIVRALGWRGFLQRVRLAGQLPSHEMPSSDELPFPAPVPLSQLQMKVGVMAHVFYPDLMDEFAQALAPMPLPYVLMVSVVDETARQQAEARFGKLPNLLALHVRIVPNRGRDIAPLLVDFREEILALDVVAHIHTKKSLYAGGEQSEWRRYLLSALMGDSRRIAWQLGMFQAEPRLGMVYPESYTGVPLWAHTWLSNTESGRELGQRLGIGVETQSYIDFPAGSMFWARVDALRPLYDLRLKTEDFPEERGQTDGTLQHAIERMFVVVTRQQGMRIGILPTDGRLALSGEGARNWQQGLDTPLATRLKLSALDAKLVSLDVFDTLVVRPFLTARGMRAYLSHVAARRHRVSTFAELRERAEAKARAQAGRDVDLHSIYRTMATLPGCGELPVDELEELELSQESRLLKPRQGLIEAADALRMDGKRLIALSDMYISAQRLRELVPEPARTLPQEWYVSCDTGWRKDGGSAWQSLPECEGVEPAQWLHVGDNEQADVQCPQAHGLLTPVHVFRPSALFEIVPALRPLRPPAGSATRWQDQLWLGLVANRFADQADRAPQAFKPRPTLSQEGAGYIVLGPLLFDYLAWLSRLALQRGVSTLLFLSREGYLMRQAFEILQRSSPALASLRGFYLLASRRATGMAGLRSFDDLPTLLDGNYTGSLANLLRARLGQPAAAAASRHLAADALRREVFLPEMQQDLQTRLHPAASALMETAAHEREAYLQYWNAEVGTQPAMVADLGYSGTIQANLSRLTGMTLGGGYLALNGKASKLTGQGWAAARYHDGRELPSTPSTILQYDLLLETLLTAPDPQFSHFEIHQGLPRPVYAEPEHSTAQLALISQVHEGALQFFRDVCEVTGEESWELEFDRDLVQAPLRCLGSGRWHGNDWLPTLSVVDDFTGRGRVYHG